MSKFKDLVKKLMGQGKSKKAAQAIAYSIGANKYGKKKEWQEKHKQECVEAEMHNYKYKNKKNGTRL